MPDPGVFDEAAVVLAAGGIIAYPTEGVFGLGCLPGLEDAASRLMSLKSRQQDAGFILVAARTGQLSSFVAPAEREVLARRMAQFETPTTWVVHAKAGTPVWLTGGRDTIAVRISAHPVVRALCIAADSALVSTSANRSGEPPITDADTLHREFGRAVDMIVPGELGGLGGATEIRLASDASVLRAGAPPRDMP